MQGTQIVLSVGILERNGLIGKLDADLSGIFADTVVLREDVPYSHQVIVIVVAYLQVGRTYSRRTYHDVHSVHHGFFNERQIELRDERPQTCRIELADVGLIGGFRRLPGGTRVNIGLRRIVCPGRIQMQTEHVAIGLLHAGKQLGEIALALGGSLNVVRRTRAVPGTAPSPTVKIHVRRVHHAMKHHMIAVTVHQPPAFHMQRR